MKKLSILLIFIPILLITSLNFYGGSLDINHPIESRAFTCSSCHATIIDGIIIGKEEINFTDDYVEIELLIPTGVSFNGVSINMKGEKTKYLLNNKLAHLNDDYGQLFALDITSDSKGKKEKTIKIKYPISETETKKGSLEIQGVLSNLDNKPGGEYSFYKKISLDKDISKKEILVYPTIADKFIFIKNTSVQSNVQIFDLNGQLLLEKTINTKSEIIDVSTFSDGYYFVKVGEGKNIYTSKLVVKK